MMKHQWLLLLTAVLSFGTAMAQAELTARADSAAAATKVVDHQWMWGAGHSNVLDTYLSPLEYTGPDFNVLHRTERPLRRTAGRLSLHTLFTAHLAYLHSPTDDGKEWDGELSLSGGALRNWQMSDNWRLAAGCSGEVSGGFTYNTRGSNNPAQGRLGLSLQASALSVYGFKLLGKAVKWTVQADLQLAGLQFSPEYGQSYYEIFELGHTSGIVHLTHPANCPTGRLLTTLSLPLRRAELHIGCLADVRQSKLGGLKRHAWRNCLTIGYSYRLQRVGR
ncbi:MAG: DUF3316 domain-containing protein [Alloprevotella sp.]